MNYKKTLNLPKTDFPMRAGLPKLEPKILASWREDGLYEQLVERGQKQTKKFVLHDGPPYANGHVHLGTALNKILKDIIVKSRTMLGYYAPYVPGWDCHGMPIEHNVVSKLKPGHGLTKLQIRQRCREFANEFLDIQREEFQRLGCLGDWNAPYITMSTQYEAETVAALGDLVRGGYVYRGQRPIHWCGTCRTALAEAELEYHEHTSPSIYVKFPVQDGDPKLQEIADQMGQDLRGAAVLIWTTTPWTIPANLAIALHPEFEYVFVRQGDDLLLMADFLRPVTTEALGWDDAPVVGSKLPGARLEGMVCRHPMFDRDSVVILADYVTLDTGTGAVHTAPGHGAEDFESGKKYGLEVLSPVDDGGLFTSEVPDYEGVSVFEANQPISDRMRASGHLLASQKITHTYPYCWRCKQPLIFRATDQWFLNVDHEQLRHKALLEIEKVSWIPPWGQQRIHNMVETRPDWCLSRQRSWGVPIPAVHCLDCGEASLSEEVIDRVKARVAEQGTDVWFEQELESFLPEGFACPHCKGTRFRKEEDILDVWFDSSCSQRAVLEHHDQLAWPCDLYLEATDQHRGWFQVSLLTAMGTRKAAPYRQVLTHGLILDEHAKKMSKSLGNVIAPQKVIDQYGADVLRLLFSSVDYTADICFTRDMLSPMSDAYRKIRNTLRFMMGNLADFDPSGHLVDENHMSEVDRWMRARMRQVAARVEQAYLRYEFHTIYHLLLELCTVDLSAFYLDVTKDRLYAQAADDPLRRSTQSALYRTTLDLLSMLAPILVFTVEEAWSYLPKEKNLPPSAHLAQLPDSRPADGDADLLNRWAQLRKLRTEMNKAMETLRQDGKIKDSLDGALVVTAPDEIRVFLESFGAGLAELCKVARVEFTQTAPADSIASETIEGLKIQVNLSEEGKCERCWNRRPEVGTLDASPGLCSRCAQLITASQD